jgi:long-chain acyl-CoA synthetase
MNVADFFAAISRHKTRPALNDGVQIWTYERLEHEVRAWTARLQQLDAKRVAYRLYNGCNWVALDLALLSTDRIAVPIPDFFSASQERHVLAKSGVDTCVLDTHDTIEGFHPAGSNAGCHILQACHSRAPAVHAGTAKITFTSGTTGQPKGVCLSASHLLTTAAAIEGALGGEPEWRHLCVLPLSLLLENVAGVYANLGAGHEVCVPRLSDVGVNGSSGLDVARFMRAQNDFRPHSIILVPQLLLAMTAAAEFGVALPDSYRFVAVGGGTVPRSLIERAQRVGIPVFEGYGLTECGSVVALNLPDTNRAGSVGRPLGNVGVELVRGEIHVLGSSMLGYLGAAPATNRIATGDLGRIDEAGFVQVLGRRKNGFITAYGRNVSPEWIESELQTEFAIAYAAVFGEALPENVALIVARGNADDAAIQTAVDAANARLPDYARVAMWRSISPDEFAAAGCLTANGRPRRDAIVRLYRADLDEMYSHIKEQLHEAVRKA